MGYFRGQRLSGRHQCRVLEPALLEKIRPELESVRPMPAVFEQTYVKRLNGSHVKRGQNKLELAEQVRDDIRKFKANRRLARVVMLWCGSTEIFIEHGAVHHSLDAFEKGLVENHPDIAPSMIYAYAALKEACPMPTARRI